MNKSRNVHHTSQILENKVKTVEKKMQWQKEIPKSISIASKSKKVLCCMQHFIFTFINMFKQP